MPRSSTEEGAIVADMQRKVLVLRSAPATAEASSALHLAASLRAQGRAIAEVAHARGALVHSDAAQSMWKLPVTLRDLGVDLLTVAGHKFSAPKGVGALIVRRGVLLEPLIHGAGHEAGRRAGTENVPYLAGLGTAA